MTWAKSDECRAEKLINVVCPRCSKRLGLLCIDDSMQPERGLRITGYGGRWYAKVRYVDVDCVSNPEGWGQAIANEDWLSVQCPRCDFTWQGRFSDVHRLLREAEQLGLKRIELRKVAAQAVGAPNVPSRSW